MNSLVEIQAAAPNAGIAEKAMDAAIIRMGEIEKETSRFIPESYFSQISQNAGKKPVKIDGDVLNFLKRGKNWGDLSGGKFDITIGTVTGLWDFESQILPDQTKISRLLPLVDYRNLILNEADSTAYLTQERMVLESGGNGQGFAVDEAVEVLKKMGISKALVNVSGDIRALGEKPGGKPWKIGIKHPRKPEEIIAAVPLNNRAIVTSGDYEQCFFINGTRYHHILDPDSGQPARELMSVTIIADLAETADSLSTAVFVMGRDKGLALVKSQPGCEAMIVTLSGEVITTAGFPK